MTALPERPPLSSLICTFALLGQDPDGLESALILAEAGLLAGFVSMADTASTAPADNVIQFLHLPASLRLRRVLACARRPGSNAQDLDISSAELGKLHTSEHLAGRFTWSTASWAGS